MIDEELLGAVAAAAQGSPYAVTRTHEGFDVALDIADDHWWTLLGKAGLRKTYVHHVAAPGDGTFAVTDDSRTVEWVGGVPRLSAQAERVHGRVRELGVEKAWGVREDGTIGTVVDYRFSSAEGRDLVTAVAKQLGRTERRAPAEKIGLVFAGVALVGAVVTAVTLLILFFLGKF
ncbi:hypothetical protein ASG88_16965 [Nocardioides sp. Soil777]|uniref:hypothetical protein n=1 Tax=Nocardioides sp. Soil777 TaxID=1736409 RepID=UPI0007024536|nr:hypothetical protein [Nocardioides sp. Soil777]KRE98737.1 hypothetical protein ASG88_16965 [Nocardioides sp. Soil777]